jgi:hypothetical protein
MEKSLEWLALENCKPEPGGIIARGEATGHHHRLATLEVTEVFDLGWDNNLFVRVGPNDVSIAHEEHKPVTLEGMCQATRLVRILGRGPATIWPSHHRSTDGIESWNALSEWRKRRKGRVRLGLVPISHGEIVIRTMIRIPMLDGRP